MEEIKVRRAEPGDLRAVIAVERPAVGSPSWSEAVWEEALSGEGNGRGVFVAEIREAVVGFIVVARTGAIAEIESVAVADAVRRQGIGWQLCDEGVEWARRMGATAIELEVRASNEAALTLYKTLGFMEQGRRRAYYSAPAEDAVLMGLALRK